MNQLEYKELFFLLDRAGAVIAFQEKNSSWAGALAFSDEAHARALIDASHLEVAEIAALALDEESVASLVAALKQRPIRCILLDLDYHSGMCRQIEFEGNRLGAVRERQFSEHQHG
ncbi:MAG: hypothetical protein ACREQ4_11750 [Candidatus Binataceae bacterium]